MEGEPSPPLTATFGVIYYSLMCVPGMDGEPSPPLTATFWVIYFSLICVPGMEGEPSPPLTATFWVQLKSTLVRNLIRKKRNKRHTLRVSWPLLECHFKRWSTKLQFFVC